MGDGYEDECRDDEQGLGEGKRRNIVCFRASDRLVEALDQRAAADERTRSWLIHRMLERELEGEAE